MTAEELHNAEMPLDADRAPHRRPRRTERPG